MVTDGAELQGARIPPDQHPGKLAEGAGLVTIIAARSRRRTVGTSVYCPAVTRTRPNRHLLAWAGKRASCFRVASNAESQNRQN